MNPISLKDASGLRDRIRGFLEDASTTIESLATDKTGANYWRDLADASSAADPGTLRPTVTFNCLEAAWLQACLSGSPEAMQKWLTMAISAVKKLNAQPGSGMDKLSSTMTGKKPNVLTASHLGSVLASLCDTDYCLPLAKRLTKDERALRDKWISELTGYLKSHLETLVVMAPGDAEHPYLVYRAVECAIRLSPVAPPLKAAIDTCMRRATQDFNRLAAAITLGGATPAEGVDLALLWSTSVLCSAAGFDGVGPERLDLCLEHVLRLSEASGDWPLGHALSAEYATTVVPSGEVAGAILNAVLRAMPLGIVSLDAAMLVLAHIRPLAERVMRNYRRVSLAPNRDIRGWSDSRLVRDIERLQTFTTSSHLVLLMRCAACLGDLIRASVCRHLAGEEPRRIETPGFLNMSEVDSVAPVGEFIWDTFVCTVDPLAPSLSDFRKRLSGAPTLSLEEQLQEGLVVNPRRLRPPTKKSKNVSFILYGPPGTGKTTYVKAIAKQLEWPLITITPGNFTRRGEEGIETAAQEIFDQLSMTDRVVVLLDECDELFRRRDDEETGARTLLSFLTASMLPKLANLHDRAGLIFAVATNYVDRMDLAAIRGGRIDHHIAVPPPDTTARHELLAAKLTKDIAAVLGAKAIGRVSEETEGLTRDEVEKLAERMNRIPLPMKPTEARKLATRSVEHAVEARMNSMPLLVQFYEHMRLNSAPVVQKGDAWSIPSGIAMPYGKGKTKKVKP